MEASNLALRLEPAEDQPEPSLGRRKIQRSAAAAEPEQPRPPRRSRALRTIVTRDQGLRLFRCG